MCGSADTRGASFAILTRRAESLAPGRIWQDDGSAENYKCRGTYLASIAAMARVGEPRAALTAYGGFLKRWPDNLPASITMANSYYALGELANAEAILRRAAARNPDSVIVLNNLAQTVSDEGRNEEAHPRHHR